MGYKCVYPNALVPTLHACSSVSGIGLAKYEQTGGSSLMVMTERLIKWYPGLQVLSNGIEVGVRCIICCIQK